MSVKKQIRCDAAAMICPSGISGTAAPTFHRHSGNIAASGAGIIRQHTPAFTAGTACPYLIHPLLHKNHTVRTHFVHFFADVLAAVSIEIPTSSIRGGILISCLRKYIIGTVQGIRKVWALGQYRKPTGFLNRSAPGFTLVLLR